MREDSGQQLLRRMTARRRRDNIVFGVLAVLAVIGGVTAVASWLLPGPPAPSSDPTVATVGHSHLVGSFAEEFVVAYLSATEAQRDRLVKYVDVPPQVTLPKSRRPVTDPAVVYVRRTEATEPLEVWSVTISARIGPDTSAVRQYFGVGVSLVNGRPRALALPALVDGPAQGVPMAQAYSASCVTDSPLAAAVSGFLAAFLTGTGDLSRYTSVDAGIAAPVPPPYTGIESITVSSDDSSCGTARSQARVLATVTPKDRDGPTTTLAYPLQMVRATGQQWQVHEVEIVPALANPLTIVTGGPAFPSASATPTPTSSTSTATIPPPVHN